MTLWSSRHDWAPRGETGGPLDRAAFVFLINNQNHTYIVIFTCSVPCLAQIHVLGMVDGYRAEVVDPILANTLVLWRRVNQYGGVGQKWLPDSSSHRLAQSRPRSEMTMT